MKAIYTSKWVKVFLFIIALAIIYWAIYIVYDKHECPISLREGPVSRPEYSVRRAGAQLLQANVELFRRKENRLPATLDEVVEKGYIQDMPYDEGEPFKYDPNTGRVE